MKETAIKLSSVPEFPYDYILLIINGNIAISLLWLIIGMLSPLAGGTLDSNILISCIIHATVFFYLKKIVIYLKKALLVKRRYLFIFLGIDSIAMTFLFGILFTALTVCIATVINIVGYNFLLSRSGISGT